MIIKSNALNYKNSIMLLYSVLVLLISIFLKQYYILLIMLIPIILFISNKKLYIFVLIGVYYIFPKGMPFGLNVFTKIFSWGVADVVLIIVGLYLLFTSSIVTKKIEKESIEYSIIFIYLIQIVSFLIDIAFGVSIPFVIANLIKYIEPLIFYVIIKKYYKGSGAELRNGILIICVIVNIVGIIQIVNPELYYRIISSSINSEGTVDYISTFMYGRVASTLLNPGTYAWFLIVVIPLQIYCITEVDSLLKKIFHIIITFSSIVMLILTQSRTQWIALGIMAIVYLGITIKTGNKKRITIILGYLLLIAYIISEIYGEKIVSRLLGFNANNDYNYFGLPMGFSMAARINFFRAGINAIKDNTLIGVGYCNISNILGSYVSRMDISNIFKIQNPTIHNQYLSLMLQTGIPIFCVILYLYYKIIKIININSKQDAFGTYLLLVFVGIIVSSFTGDILYSSRISSMLLILIAALEIDKFSTKNKDKLS